jgi:cell division protease FtsH
MQTTGAGNDIERATELARKMVCEWGMSEEMGPLSFGKKEEQIFLGREIAQHRDYSESTAIKIDDEVKNLVSESHDRATDILTENLDFLHKLANALLEREVLGGDEIDMIIHGEKLPEMMVRPGKMEDHKDEEASAEHDKEEEAGKVEGDDQNAPPEAD